MRLRNCFKKGTWDIGLTELVMIILVLVIFPVSVALGGQAIKFLSPTDPEATSSIRTFETLVENVNNLLKTNGAYAYNEDTIMSLDKDYAIAGFLPSNIQDKLPIFIWGLSGSKRMLSRPESCGTSACMCLIKKTSQSSKTADDYYDLKNAMCKTFGDNVIFYSQNEFVMTSPSRRDRVFGIPFEIYQSDADQNILIPSYGLAKRGSSFNLPLVSIKYDSETRVGENYFDDYLDDLNTKEERYLTSMFFAGTLPSIGTNEIEQVFITQGFYIDKVDTNMLNLPSGDSSKRVYVFVAPSKMMYDRVAYIGVASSVPNKELSEVKIRFEEFFKYLADKKVIATDYVKWDNNIISEQIMKLTLPNIVVDFRKAYLGYLAHKDSSAYSSYILNSQTDEEAIYYFLDYLSWLDNTLLHKSEDRNVLLEQLGSSAIGKIKDILEAIQAKCAKENTDETKQNDCFAKYFDDCTKDYIKDKDKCAKVKVLIASDNRYALSKEALYNDVLTWYAEVLNKNKEIVLLLANINAIDEKNVAEKYDLFLKYADDTKNKLKSTNEDYPEDLEPFKKALRMHETYTSSTAKVEGPYGVSSDENQKYYILSMLGNEYVYAPDLPGVAEYTSAWDVGKMSKPYDTLPGLYAQLQITSTSKWEYKYLLEQTKRAYEYISEKQAKNTDTTTNTATNSAGENDALQTSQG